MIEFLFNLTGVLFFSAALVSTLRSEFGSFFKGILIMIVIPLLVLNILKF